jgi:2-methylcitrate dehydratase PrpD
MTTTKKMTRRRFLKSSLITGAVGAIQNIALIDEARAQQKPVDADFKLVNGLTQKVAEFAVDKRFEEIPDNVNELAKKSILDGIGLAIFGATQDTGTIISKYTVGYEQVKPVTTVIGGHKLPSRFAAFANGVAIHVSDYDDTQLAVGKDRVYGLLTHPTVPVFPVALAVGELDDGNGRELLLAYQVGVEVESKLAEAISPRHYKDGFHTTGTCGVFGGAIAASKLRKFGVEATIRAMGIAGSQAAGLRENFGTMMKPFHAGHAAEVGVVSADLAALGWTATDNILESPRGFFHAYGGSYDPAVILGRLGNPWTFADPGVSIKPFPSGSLTHPAMGAVMKLIEEHNVRAADVEQVYVGTNRQNPNALIHHDPKNALQAKFSMEFCVAILLLERNAGLREFTDQVVNRPDVRAMIKKVSFAVDPEAESSGYDKMTSIIRIHLKDGTTLSGRADFAKGSPSNPMSYDEVAGKFMDCCTVAGWPESKAREIVEKVHTLEKLPYVRSLAALCSK